MQASETAGSMAEVYANIVMPGKEYDNAKVDSEAASPKGLNPIETHRITAKNIRKSVQ